MKGYKLFLMGIVFTLLMLSTFWAGSVYAATDCFTDIGTLPTVFQEAICWMKDNGITSGYPDGTYKPSGTVTRAQMALFMKNQAEVPPSTGNILVTMGADEWLQNRVSPNALTFNRYYTDTEIKNASTGYGYILGLPELPDSLYGHALSLSGVEFCYQASTSVHLVQFDLYIDTQTNGIPTAYVNPATDATARTDAACRLYTFTPVVLSGEKIVSIKIHANWTVAGSSFYLGRATFVLQPTTTVAPPLTMPEPLDVSPLEELPSPRD